MSPAVKESTERMRNESLLSLHNFLSEKDESIPGASRSGSRRCVLVILARSRARPRRSERDWRLVSVMANCSAGEISYLPRIADFFHSFTHLNFYFDNVSSIFAPTLPDYQQVGEYLKDFSYVWVVFMKELICTLFSDGVLKTGTFKGGASLGWSGSGSVIHDHSEHRL